MATTQRNGAQRIHTLPRTGSTQRKTNVRLRTDAETLKNTQAETGNQAPAQSTPCLAWLQDNAFIKELPTENGLKRYEITPSGKELLEEQVKIREKFMQEGGPFASPFFDRFFGNAPKEKTNQIRCSMKRLMMAALKVGRSMRENYSEKDLDEALKVLDEAAGKLEELNKKNRRNKHE